MNPLPILTEEQIKIFHSLQIVKGKNECYGWSGTKRFGYGKFRMGKAEYFAHRLSFLLHTGKDPEKLFVLHSCDNPECSNPNHLFLGTNRDNMLDAMSKGRAFVGEKNHRSKLTKEKIIAIRNEYADGGISQSALAKKYSIDQGQICNIINKKAWVSV